MNLGVLSAVTADEKYREPVQPPIESNALTFYNALNKGQLSLKAKKKGKVNSHSDEQQQQIASKSVLGLRDQ